MGIVTRSVSTDTADADGSGRFAIAGTATFTDLVVQGDVMWSALDASTTAYLGVVARYVDANNWLIALMNPRDGTVRVYKRVSGTITLLAGDAASAAADVWHTLRLQVLSDGSWSVWCSAAGVPPGEAVLTGQDAALATGGALASGKIGLYDRGALDSD